MISWHRAYLLLLIYLKASLRRIRYDFVRELVVGICTLVLLLLFFYIFNDFINVKVGELSVSLRQNLAAGFSYLILILVGISCGNILRSHRLNPAELAQVAVRLGERHGTRKIYSTIKITMILAIGFGAVWYLIRKFFILDLTIWDWSIAQALPTLVTIGIWMWPVSNKQGEPLSEKFHLALIANHPRSTKRRTMIRWRLGQLLLRNRTTRICLAAAMIFHLMIALTAWLGLPFFIAALISLLAGLLVTTALTVQLEADMQHAWLEKSFGISHSDITATYLALGGILGVANGMIALSLYSLVTLTFPQIETLKLVPLTALCPLLLAGLMFQIDARRPVISIITCFLVGLFLGTAIIAHWLGISLILVAIYYSNQYQTNQYYQYQ